MKLGFISPLILKTVKSFLTAAKLRWTEGRPFSFPFWPISLSDARLALGANCTSKTTPVFHSGHPKQRFSPFAPFSVVTSAVGPSTAGDVAG